MKKSLIAGLLLSAPILGQAYTWDQTLDFKPDLKLTFLSTYTYTHDLTTDGFTPGVDSINDYSLTLKLYNDQGIADLVYVDQPGLTGDSLFGLFNWTYASLTTGDSYKGVASLNNSGLLTVSVTSWLGTFFLDTSTLIAEGVDGEGNTASVPEPGSVALLAAGLLGIAVMRRNSKKTD